MADGFHDGDHVAAQIELGQGSQEVEPFNRGNVIAGKIQYPQFS